jgi:hypothetical protein
VDVALSEIDAGGNINTFTVDNVYIVTKPVAMFQCELELLVKGDDYTVLLNGKKVNSYTIISNQGNTGVGFGFNYFRFGTPLNAFGVRTFELSAVTRRGNKIVSVCGGSVFVGDLKSLPMATGGSGVLSPDIAAQAGYFNSKGYLVDGVTIIQLNLISDTIEEYVESAGTKPDNCTLATAWRGRLVLVSESTWFMSRINDPHDWDYGRTDEAAAVYHLGDKTFGAIGDTIVAVASLTSDVLVFLCDHTIYTMEGDAIGGSIVVNSEQVGGLGPNCWTKDPGGTFWFAGTGGFYRMATGSPPECVSNASVNEFFRSIDRSENEVTVTWDRDRWGAFIFVTPRSGTVGTHLFYDARGGGFWRIQYPDYYGPTSALVYDGDESADRVLLMGGQTGFIFHHDNLLDQDDDRTAINSYIYLGPIIPADDLHEIKVYTLQAYLSEQQWGAPIESLIRESDVITMVQTGHGLVEGDSFTIVGASIGWNGTFTVASVVDGDTITYANKGDDDHAEVPGFRAHINNLDWLLQGAMDAFGTVDGVATTSAGGSWSDKYGRQPSENEARMRALSLSMRVGNATVDRRFSFERFVLPFAPGAQIRT